MRNKTSAYNRLKNKNTGSFAKDIMKKEETYWFGAAVPAMLFAGFIDGGVSIAIAYAARKLYEMNNGKV